ncbi:MULTISPECIES: subtype B tannase [Emticicia]|uniref:subtype B tannase n=1 Tax=Emticicia TaxID=312278 RepID=UPI0007D89A16|nr:MULTISPECIES: subtype B tannase [Emticicia]
MKIALFGSFCGLLLAVFTTKAQNNLQFDASKYETQTQDFNGKTIKVRAYEKVIYVANPVDLIHHILNIYIPEEYFTGGTINGYSAENAPIFFPNRVGGYMPAVPATFVVPEQKGGFPYNNKTVLTALSKGYIVASAGARGRINKNEKGEFTGKAPAGIVDLKAAVRYLKFNDKLMAGDANKIISNGTSAGGAMSTLLGATGNHPDYDPYLKALGAANATDNIFAVSAYCPITNLENADMAYEWQLNKIHTYNFRGKAGELNAESIKVSDDLKAAFPNYINGLNLKNDSDKRLSLDAEGNGNFKDLVKLYIVASAQKAIDAGMDLSKHSFLKIEIDASNRAKVLSVDYDAYMIYLERMKTPPAFDALDNKSFENNLFGTVSIDNQHFTTYASTHSKDLKATMANKQTIKMMNPMNYIGDKQAKTAKNWRIRHGAKDKDTGFAISVILATMLKNKGYQANLELPWDKPHSGDYDLEELFNWADGICK